MKFGKEGLIVKRQITFKKIDNEVQIFIFIYILGKYMALNSNKYLMVLLTGCFLFLSSKDISAKEHKLFYVIEQDDKNKTEGTYVLIEGGHDDFLKEGMNCRIFLNEKFPYNKDTLKLSLDMEVGEIVEVDAFSSICFLKYFNKEIMDIIFPYATIKTVVLEPSPDVIFQDAEDAYDAENFIKAKIYFEKVMELSPEPDSSMLINSIEKCEKEIKNQKISHREKRSEEKKIPKYQELGFYFWSKGNFEAATYYYDKILNIDSKNYEAQEFLKIIKDSKYQEEITEVDSLIEMEKYPEMILEVNPEYPPEAEQNNLEGMVLIRSLISKTGKVIDAAIERSSGHLSLDNAALIAAFKNRYTPGYQKGKPINCWVIYQVEFSNH